MSEHLEGFRVAILATDLFEEAELIEPRKALDEAGATTVVIAPHAGYIYSGAVAGAVYAHVEVPRRVIVLCPNHTGMGESITVRKVSFGQGVERIFPIHARVIDHIDVVRTGRVRRAKLYYLRGLKGKAARLRER